MLNKLIYTLYITLALVLQNTLSKEFPTLEIQGIEPIGGPVYGETRVTVRIKNFNKNLIDEYPHPKCRFGNYTNMVNATYIECTPTPRAVGSKEPMKEERNETCIICELSPAHEAEIVPFTASLMGDFTDVVNSVPFRYYLEPEITWIYPRYGPKDGNTFVEIFGKNFLNFDQNLRCGFGSREVKAYYVSDEYIICYSPKSDIVQKELPFTLSLNNQQNTKQSIDYVYFEFPQVFRLEPNKGPDTGGTTVHIRGQNMDPMHDLPWKNYNDTFCKFGNLSLTNAEVVSSTEMICTSPPSYEDREVPVEITLNNREWTRDGVLFYYYHPPFIYGINPKIGPVDGGTVVRVTGSNFEDTGFVMCKFGAIFTKGEYISQNELRCTAPQVERPGYVNLFIAIRPDQFSSGYNTRYFYYDTPQIDKIEPMCGPESGYTQITIYGKNFVNTGSDYVKCVFDGKIFMNATVLSENEIKCDSPSVLNYEGKNEKNITEYDVEITQNGKDLNGPKQKFYYYKDTIISAVDPIYGPKSGNTTVNITGMDFTQPGACNVTVRFATYHLKPIERTKTYMTVSSPQVNFTGATVVQVALNGRQFDKDIHVHNRDEENTFYYYNSPLLRTMSPKKGPTNGGTDINLLGAGFDDVFFKVKNVKNKIMFYKFIDAKDNTTQYGDIYNTTVTSSHIIQVTSPRVYKNGTEANIHLAYNKQNFENSNKKLNFTYYILPNITNVSPKYGPLKTIEKQYVQVTLDNYYCTENCDKLTCKYKSKTNTFIQKAVYIRPNTVNCTVPTVNIPEAYNIEASFNGDDYTNNGYNYTFYDPYVTKVVPQMVSAKGGTKLDIYGFGFADSGENLNVQFGSTDNRLRCQAKSCIVDGLYRAEDRVQAVTYPMNQVSQSISGQNIGFRKHAVEVSVYNNDFTDNNVTIFYFEEPEIIEDIYNTDVPMDSKDRDTIATALIQNIPANLDTVILIPIDSRAINQYYDQFNQYANYTCKYTMKQEPYETKTTYGVITSFPTESNANNLYICQSPVWENVGEANVTISINGYDYSSKSFHMVFTDPINIFKIEPPCGPRSGDTTVKITGTGFIRSSEYVFKWGVQNLVNMVDTQLKELDKNALAPKIVSSYPMQEITIKSPRAPVKDNTLGGPDYISYSKRNFFPEDDHKTKHFTNNYVHTNFEFFYYHQPYVQSISPHGSIVNGGTKVLVVGAWFDYQPEYGVKPYCKFGNKIVEGEFLSTVRISCIAPEYDTPNVRVPFEVSLNKQDFTNSGIEFTYYNDYTKAKFYSMEPSSGPSTGGTNIKIFGESFTSLLNPEEFLCQFTPNDERMQAKNVPAGFKDFGNNKTAIICNTPGGWTSGSIADIKITFDGQNFIDTGYDFYFYKIEYLNPASGPSKGNGPINVMGSGFQNTTKVRCVLNKIEMAPIDVYEDRILCPMTQSTYGKNFTGSVDFGVTLNGIDWKIFTNGFYYYIQPEVEDMFPQTGPSKGNGIVKVFGKRFRDDFAGSNIGCKAGNNYGYGYVKSDKEMECNFNDMPLLTNNSTLNFTVALNNYSFTGEQAHLNYTPYGLSTISPSSGPIDGGTRIEVRGAGFHETTNLRCRFGVEGWYGYTEGQFIDYGKMVCHAPLEFKIPQAAQLPFSVPFAIAVNEDKFNPWTETAHFYSLYENPSITNISPTEGKTTETTLIDVKASLEKPFSMPSATVEETEFVDYTKSSKGEKISRKAIAYQPISCRFGRFGVTQGTYYNRTLIKCLTPTIKDDSDIGYEEVPVEVALNGVDYVANEDMPFTFMGPNAGRMLWVYVLITIFAALLIILLVALISSYWNKIAVSDRNVYSGEEPHVLNKKPKYFQEAMLQDNDSGN